MIIQKVHPLWWVGKKVQCENCLSTITLETGDQNKIKEYRVGSGMVEVYFDCPVCSENKKKTELRCFLNKT